MVSAWRGARRRSAGGRGPNSNSNSDPNSNSGPNSNSARTATFCRWSRRMRRADSASSSTRR
eukprot:scaffold9528_cov60-Phaeocystis_antarctica.AAC.3